MCALKYQDSEADFWKEIFVHLQHKNMVRPGAERLDFSDVKAAFDRFSLANPQIAAVYEINQTSASWEAPVTSTIRLRLFFQNQIKASLLQRQGSDFVKIADAKFPYNPFPEISEFLSRTDLYQVQLHEKIEKVRKDDRRTKLAEEFIKAALEKKFSPSKTVWRLEEADSQYQNAAFVLVLGSVPAERKIPLSEENFMQEIRSL
ncbi:MAG: hypothetical protein IJ688_07665 [Treponema sp.]|nr:hypothetical protein [Treponema sp.]